MLAIFKHNIQANLHWKAMSFKELWLKQVLTNTVSLAQSRYMHHSDIIVITLLDSSYFNVSDFSNSVK